MTMTGKQVRVERRAIPGMWPDEPDAEGVRDWLAVRLARGERPGAIRIGLSRFDIVNAAYGRATGRALIEAASERIADVVANVFVDGFVARVAGADFIACGESERVEAAAVAIEAAFARPFELDDAVATLGARIGTALARDGEDADRLLTRVADALAVARTSDGPTICTDGTAGVRLLDRLAVELHGALARDEIYVLFQPQVDLAHNRITGVEALARWDHPTLGAIGAEQLFAAAARADLGRALSAQVQRLALDGATRWDAALDHLRLSVNVTAADLARPGFTETLLAGVDASGFPRGRLTIEMTEGALIGDLDAAAGWFETLRAAGCRMAIDDFGAGYSSLAYLQTLPLDYLKLDRTLIRDLEANLRAREVLSGIIGIAHRLDLSVIVEGVETEVQRDLLSELGCDSYQGFLCAEPIDDAMLTTLVRRWG